MEERLLAEEGEAPDHLFLGGGELQSADAFLLFERGAEPLQEVALFFALRVLGFFQVLVQTLQPGFDRDEVGQEELVLHSPDVILGIDGFGCGQAGVLEPADDVDQAVGLAEDGEERRVLDFAEGNAGQVGQVQTGRDFLLVRSENADAVQALVGQGTGPVGGFALRLLEVVDFFPGAGEQVEQRRLARPGIAENGHVHATSKARKERQVKPTPALFAALVEIGIFGYSNRLKSGRT